MKQSIIDAKKYWFLAVFAIVLDQIFKYLVLKDFILGERVSVLSGLLDITLAFNPGAAFSFLADAGGWQKYFFIALAFGVSFYLSRAIVKNEFATWGKWGASMIIGGALGNVIDRVIHGHVTDFILVYYQDWHYPVFNTADMFICVGAACLIIDMFKQPKKEPK